jgi:two-component system response regulator (stage 0 sporulation protein F)
MAAERRLAETRTQGPREAWPPRKRLVAWGPRILLVEDDAEMRRMLAALLRRDGYSVTEAVDGDEALEWLGTGILDGEPSRLPALIISDVRLPCLSGLDILAGSRLWPRRIPVVLITGFGDEALHAQAAALGAVCVLDKPFPIAALRAAVKAALQRPEDPGPWGRDGHVV